MLRIKTFGGLLLERGGTRFEGSSPRRSALLAILAVAGKRGVSRDRLLLYLWPDTTEERARHNLAQTVYSIQKAVGADVIESLGTELRLVDSVETDVGDFLAAETRGDSAMMATLYQGPFLDGFILSDSAEFDEWAGGERARLNRLASEAIERQAQEADRSSRPEAVGLWRRLTILDPVATRYAMGLARALDRGGDPGAAARHLRAHERLLKSEVGAASPAELRTLLESLGRPVPAGPLPPPAPPELSTATPPERLEGSAPAPLPAVRRSPRVRQLAVAAVVAAAGGILAWRSLTKPVRPMANGEMVVLADFENLTADTAMGRALQVAATVTLQQSPGFSLYSRGGLRQSLVRMGRPAANPVFTEELAREVAARESGRVVVAMTVAQLGQQFVLAARLVEPSDGRIVATKKVTVDGQPELLDGVDQLGAWVRRQLGDLNWKPVRPLPLVTTRSLPALVALADAQQAAGQGRWNDVHQTLERALAADTGFAMAMRSLGDYFLATNRVTESLKWYRAASERTARMTEPEQISVRAALAEGEGRFDDQVQATRELATRFPSAANWGWLGEALRRTHRTEEAVSAFRKAADLAPNSAEPHLGMATSLKQLGDLRSALDEYDKVFQLDSMQLLRAFENIQWGETYVRAGQLAQAESVFRKMTKVPAKADQARGFRALAYLAAYQGRYAEASGQLAVALPLEPKGGLSEYRDWVLLADVETTRGRAPAARTALDHAWQIFTTADIQAAALMFGGHQLVRAGLLDRAQAVLDTLRRRAALRPDHAQDQAALALLAADVALARGRTADAETALSTRRFDAYLPLGSSLLAEVFIARGHPDSAVAGLRSVVDAGRFGDEMQQDWLRSFERLARAAERAGDSTTARAAYSALMNQWKGGDADLPPLVTARRELARLQAASGR